MRAVNERRGTGTIERGHSYKSFGFSTELHSTKYAHIKGYAELPTPNLLSGNSVVNAT
jgi:hypothetical protein